MYSINMFVITSRFGVMCHELFSPGRLRRMDATSNVGDGALPTAALCAQSPCVVTETRKIVPKTAAVPYMVD
jgi:hypothetical protein